MLTLRCFKTIIEHVYILSFQLCPLGSNRYRYLVYSRKTESYWKQDKRNLSYAFIQFLPELKPLLKHLLKGKSPKHLSKLLGGLLYLGGLRFEGIKLRIFGFPWKLLRFCRLLRFAEMDVFSTRFSAFVLYLQRFDVYRNKAVWAYSSLYCGSQIFAIELQWMSNEGAYDMARFGNC